MLLPACAPSGWLARRGCAPACCEHKLRVMRLLLIEAALFRRPPPSVVHFSCVMDSWRICSVAACTVAGPMRGRQSSLPCRRTTTAKVPPKYWPSSTECRLQGGLVVVGKASMTWHDY